MRKINIVIDGSWLFKACGSSGALAHRTASPDYPFSFSWQGFNDTVMEHISALAGEGFEFGDRYISTSIFSLPDDFDQWPELMQDVSQAQIEITRRSVYSRSKFVDSAIESGFSDEAVHRPAIKSWMLRRLADSTYQEKQVDTTVVALLVRGAITQPEDTHVLVTGDADMIPAIKVAYPEFTQNVCVATTHPDELEDTKRQSSASYSDFHFSIPPIYLQDHVDRLLAGAHVARCVECGKFFTTQNPIPSRSQPRCLRHRR